METQNERDAPTELQRGDSRRANAQTASRPSSASGASTKEEPLFSLEPIARWAKFTRRAIRRHWTIAIGVFIAATLLGGMFFASSPPLYQSSATILLSGDRGLGGTEGVTTIASRQAASVIHRSESLNQMINELDLINNEADKTAFGQLSDTVFGALSSEETDEAKRIALRTALRESIIVFADEANSSIEVSVLWADPGQAAALAELSHKIFVAERTRVEVEPLQEAVSILASRAAQATITVDTLREELRLSLGDGAPAGSVLEGAVNTEQGLLSQKRDAELRLDEAAAGIPFRYSLLAPAEPPLRPLSGNLTGYLATLLFALGSTAAACLAIDAPRGRIVAPWQLDQLDIPVLSTIRSADY